ncbi:basic-leucine zipper (bZIP) transcription factor [Purpureocillium lavendulum]|uniref:Basic-leucine zipper (BZIP) transcription factor n=1 Tax=Purpureocillium lavendulum TaxID=1247861 RepID=A0AB34G7H4_9HYPO|nr:basic-leucine zipper (bZIP) transcription factor [Purpureocillium lavendulum]
MQRSPSMFLLLGGVASLPGATLVRYLAKKPSSLSRRVEFEADWEWVRLFGSASPAVQARKPVRAARPGRRISM